MRFRPGTEAGAGTNALIGVFLVLPLLGVAQTLGILNAVKTYGTLTNLTVTMSGRAELRLTGTDDPIPGCVIHLNSPDAWMLMTRVLPVPAPARMRTGPRMASTAWRCCGLSVLRSGIGRAV